LSNQSKYLRSKSYSYVNKLNELTPKFKMIIDYLFNCVLNCIIIQYTYSYNTVIVITMSCIRWIAIYLTQVK